jgi:hypothetical protein
MDIDSALANTVTVQKKYLAMICSQLRSDQAFEKNATSKLK